MLIQFIAVAAAVAILVDRPFIWRCLILASAVPVALVANILRITLTAVASEYTSPQFTHTFHELMGWLMMPLGILLLVLELGYLDRAFPPKEEQRLVSVV
jgi:exosortase/archaeosortase family protein